MRIAASCPGFNDWKYGMDRAAPLSRCAATPAQLEQTYVARQVIYLLGTKDTNPNHSALDKSCMAEAQGPYRYARGHSYAAAMAGCATRARRTTGSGMSRAVGHDGDKMLTSACGLKALFDFARLPRGSLVEPRAPGQYRSRHGRRRSRRSCGKRNGGDRWKQHHLAHAFCSLS